jgi:hypothetical protein
LNKGAIMDIFFDIEGGPSAPPAFILSLDPEAMSLQCVGDMVTISVQAHIEPNHRYWKNSQIQNIKPVLLSLHGIVYNSLLFQGSQGIGASLASIETFPLVFFNENGHLLNLSFHCSRSYIQLIEEQRASNPGTIVTLGIFFWATMYLPDLVEQGPGPAPQLVHIKSRHGEVIRISLSHWGDMLSALGYPQRRYIELPTIIPQEGTEPLHAAIEELNQAHVLFAQDRYREAVQRCRQARDKLLGEQKTTWAESFLSPIIGTAKAAMIDESIKALNRMGNVSSHGDNIEIDRDVASYVIGSMTLILDYIGRKLK